jgi:hypothetical protein
MITRRLSTFASFFVDDAPENGVTEVHQSPTVVGYGFASQD